MDYMSLIGESLAHMRLLIEGASKLYEGDAQPLSRLAVENSELDAANAFDTIGCALNDLCQEIRSIQKEHMEEVAKQLQL